MKKILFIVALIPAICNAGLIGDINSGRYDDGAGDAKALKHYMSGYIAETPFVSTELRISSGAQELMFYASMAGYLHGQAGVIGVDGAEGQAGTSGAKAGVAGHLQRNWFWYLAAAAAADKYEDGEWDLFGAVNRGHGSRSTTARAEPAPQTLIEITIQGENYAPITVNLITGSAGATTKWSGEVEN